MRRFLDRLYYASGALGALFILALCALMIAQSVLRECGVRTGAVNDVVAWFCAAASLVLSQALLLRLARRSAK